MRIPRRLLIIVLAVGVVACGSSEKEPASSNSASVRAAGPAPSIDKVTHREALGVVKSSGAKLTVVNFWATWCVPCVEEFPSFVKLEKALDDRGVDVMFISTDFPDKQDKVIEFLDEHGVTGTSYMKTGNTTAFVNGFSREWSGAVPATFVFDSDGNLLTFWEGKVTYSELKDRVLDRLESA